MLLPPIFELIKASPAAVAILGATPKVYRHGGAPQGTAAPYVAWLVVGAAPENSLSCPPAIDRLALQVDCYDMSDGGAEALATAVRDAIEPHAHLTGIPIDQKETETALYRIALQFDFFQPR